MNFNVELTRCPICEKEIDDKSHTDTFSEYSCKNKCVSYYVDYSTDLITAYIFENNEYMFNIFEYEYEYFNFYMSNLVAFKKEVEYWKKDYRYLTKILETS